MLKDAGVKDELLEKLKLSGLVHQGKLTDAAKLSECHTGIFVTTNGLSVCSC